MLALPSVPTTSAFALFFLSASLQIRSEEAILAAANGRQYVAFRAAVPRWIGLPRRSPR